MVRVLSEVPNGEAENAIDNWVSNYSEWTVDPVVHTLTETNTQPDGSGTQYLRGDWRFLDQGETPTNILGDLSDRLASFQGGLWHRLGYHACTHDEDTPTPCSWTDPNSEVLESGTIPADIPTLR